MEKGKIICTFSGAFEAAEKDGKRMLSGRATVYETARSDTGAWYRVVTGKGCFANSLADEKAKKIKCLVGHDDGRIVAAVQSGTLKFEDKEDGLYFTAELADTQDGRDIFELVRRGDVSECSYGAYVKKYERERDEETDVVTYRITEARLVEVSIVGWGAIPGTAVGVAAGMESEAAFFEADAEKRELEAAQAALDRRLAESEIKHR